MQTVSLSFEVPDYSSMEAPILAGSNKKPKMKEAYPSFCIPGNKALAKSLKPGETFTAQVTFKVVEIAIHERADGKEEASMYGGGTRVELEARQMIIGKKLSVMDEPKDEEGGAEAIRDYFTKKTHITGAQNENVA